MTMDDHIHTTKQWLQTGSINLFGLPFAGKDTQASRLANAFDGIMLSSGDILRSAKDNQELQALLAAGDIIPSDLFKDIVVPYLSNDEFRDHPLILSEVGRLRGEDEVILEATASSAHPTKAVVLLALTDDEIWKRFNEAQKSQDRGNRADDKRDVLQTRLDNYYAKVMPVIDFYRQQGLLLEVDGAQSVEDVTSEIFEKLHNKASQEL